jgi:hypothetical protein
MFLRILLISWMHIDPHCNKEFLEILILSVVGKFLGIIFLRILDLLSFKGIKKMRAS